MSKSPAFQFYPKEYLASEKVQMMDLEHEGPYLRALCHCWLNGSIPSDPKNLARLIGKGCSEDYARVVQGCFNQHPTDPLRMVHERLDLERDKQRLWAEKSASGGKKSAEIRKEKAKLKGGSRVVQPKVNTAFAFPSAFPSPNKKTITHTSADEDRSKSQFEEARLAYPGSKRGLDSEWEDFKKKHGKQVPEYTALLMDGITEGITYRNDLSKLKAKFIPPWKNFKTWLHQKCWEERFPEKVFV